MPRARMRLQPFDDWLGFKAELRNDRKLQSVVACEIHFCRRALHRELVSEMLGLPSGKPLTAMRVMPASEILQSASPAKLES